MQVGYIDAVVHKDDIVVWTRDSSGKLITERVPVSDHCYLYVPDNTDKPTAKDMFGNPLKKLSFESRWEMKEYIGNKKDLFESDVPVEYKYIMENFKEPPTDVVLNTLYYDIEADYDLTDGNGHPTPENPHAPINLMQMFSNAHQEFFVIAYEKDEFELSHPKYPVTILRVSDEREMLETFAALLDELSIDILTGWYTNSFDLPYIMERAILIFGMNKAKAMFCRDGMPARRREFVNENGEDKVSWTLVGRQHCDMMEFYKKFMPGDKRSFSLNAVCEEDLKMTKVEYDGELGDLYRENVQLWAEYGLKDAELLLELDKKHGIIALACLLAWISGVFVVDTTGSVKPIEYGFLKFCHEKSVILPDKRGQNKEEFPGAIVYDTVEGRHGWVLTIDLTALYPSTMIMLGLSTETIVGCVEGGYDAYVAVMTKSDEMVRFIIEATGEEIEVSARELEAIIRENGYTISGFGVVFDGSLGLLSEYAEDRFDLRKHYQKLKKQAENDDDKKRYDMYQKAIKIVCNSLYGCISNAHFRLFDIRLAKSITISAQIISKQQAYIANQLVQEIGEFYDN